jgi:surface protein
MFQNCKTLPQIDLSTFNTKNVVNMSYMFSGCTYLEEIDLRPLNLYSCTNIRNILEKCTMLNEITFFNQAPRQAFTGQEMFSGCTNLHIFNQPETSSSFVFINLQGAFLNCSSLENLAFPQ